MRKKQSNFRLSDEARLMLKKIAGKLAISEAAALELAIRKLAKDEYPLSEKEKATS